MKPIFYFLRAMFAVLLLSVSCADSFAQMADVDPTIGNIGQLLEPTRPTASLPNEPIRVYPIRKDYLDDQITCFPLTAVSHRLGEVFALRPTVSPVQPAAWDVRMPYDHDLEVTRPWYYSTFLLRDGITVEFTPGRLTGYYRFSFPADATPSLLLDLFNDGEGYWHFPSATTLVGMETWQGGVKVYMYGSLDHDATPAAGDNARRQALTFKRGTTVVGLKYAISFISSEQAKKNYQEEIAATTFDAVKQHAEAVGHAAARGPGRPQQSRLFRAINHVVNTGGPARLQPGEINGQGIVRLQTQ